MELSMRGNNAAILILVLLTASSLMVAKPAFSSATVAENTWAETAPMHQARSVLGVAAVNSKIYAIGGSTESGFAPSIPGSAVYGDINIDSFVGTNEEYDPATNTWTFKTPMPTPRTVFATAVYQNKIYCIGGRSKVGDKGGGYTGVNEVYDTTTGTWETKTPMPTARGWLTAGVANGKIYILGGDPQHTLNQVYDPTTDSWTTKASIPFPIVAGGLGSVSAAINNKIYVIDSKTQIYDPVTDEWSQGAPPPSDNCIGAGVTTGISAPVRIYVLGLPSSSPSNIVYNPFNDSWSFGAAAPANRYNFGVAVVNDTLYAIGGHTYSWVPGNYAPVAVNEQYTPFGYGTVPPAIVVVSPENKTYNVTDFSLAFTLNKPAVWMCYSLDGQENVTVSGNTTLSGLSNGLHSLVVYANDTFGNMGASENVNFTVATPETFPTILLIGFVIVAVAVVGFGLLVYLKKRSWRPEDEA
jgi:hypothetical protein